MTISDEQLFESFCAGNPDAFGTLFERTAPELVRLAHSLRVA